MKEHALYIVTDVEGNSKTVKLENLQSIMSATKVDNVESVRIGDCIAKLDTLHKGGKFPAFGAGIPQMVHDMAFPFLYVRSSSENKSIIDLRDTTIIKLPESLNF